MVSISSLGRTNIFVSNNDLQVNLSKDVILNKLNNKTYLGNKIFMKKYSKYLMKNKTSKIITEFNSQINCNIDDEIILIGNNFVLQKTKSIVLSRFQKLKIFFYAAMSALFNKF